MTKLNPNVTPDGVTLWETPGGTIFSIDPPDAWFGFSCWSMMMPPMKPRNMLIIGAGKNTLGRLCQQKWPDLQITLVDISPQPDVPGVIEMDGFEFIKRAKDGEYDYVVLDAYNEMIPAPLMYTSDFIHELARVAKHVCVNYVDSFNEMVGTWLRIGRWRFQQYHRVVGNNIWFFSKVKV